MASGGINGTSVFIVLVGSVLVYSSVKGNTISVTLRDFLAGKTPPDTFNTEFTTDSALVGTTGTTVTGTSGPEGGQSSSENFRIIESYCRNNLGFSRAGTAGALGNIQVESGFNPTSGNAAEGAIGICQWELGRRVALDAYAAATGGSEQDLNTQLGYMRSELMTAFAPVYLYMRGASDPGSAAAFWDANYERSSGSTRQERIDNAVSIYNEIS